MATWQYTLAVVPKENLSCVAIGRKIESEEEYEKLLPWQASFFKFASDKLTIHFGNSSTLGQVTLWGKSDETCAKLIKREDETFEIILRLDLRSLKKHDLLFLIEFMEKTGCCCIDESRILMDADLDSLKAHIKQSKAFSFLNNPELFLNGISKV